MNKRLFIVFFLGFSSGLPLSLVGSTLQAWYAEAGASVMLTGMLSLLGLPYIYRMCWGPILDRYALFSLGKRRSWILSMQVILCVGFNIMGFYSPQTTPSFLAILAFMLAWSSATQDMAIEAHRTEYLSAHMQGLGASFAVFGYRLALLVSGGLALILAQQIGWAAAYHIMGFCMLIGVIATLYSPEPSFPIQEKTSFKTFFKAPFKELMTRPGIIPFLLFILLYKTGEAFTATTSGIMMPFLIQGLGFSLETIGYVNKMMGVAAILLGGFIAGFLLLRWSLSRALLVFGVMQAIANVLFMLLAMVGQHLVLFSLAVVSSNLAAGMASTALVVLLMRCVDQRFTATQMSILAAISTLPRVFSGPLAALLQSWIGWVGLYQLSVILALAFLPFFLLSRAYFSAETSEQKSSTLVSVT